MGNWRTRDDRDFGEFFLFYFINVLSTVWNPSFKATSFPWLQLKNSLSILLQGCHFVAAIKEAGFDTSYILTRAFTRSVYRTNAFCNTYRNKNACYHYSLYSWYPEIDSNLELDVLNCSKGAVLYLNRRQLLQTCSAAFFWGFLLWKRQKYLMVWLGIWH